MLREEREKGSLMPLGAGGEKGGGRSWWLEKEKPKGMPPPFMGVVPPPPPMPLPRHGEAVGVEETSGIFSSTVAAEGNHGMKELFLHVR